MNKFSSYLQTRELLLSGKVSCAQLVDHYLRVISEKNLNLNAFLEVFDESARIQADKVDSKIREGKPGRLAGLIIGIKDLFCYNGHHMTCSSKILEGFESQITSTAVQRMIDEDAIVIGRQNCDEFAMGSSNENSAMGIVRNPIKLDRVPGGSSGGSSAAVAAGMCMASLGSDTGGSIRQPASFCGIVGLKPTYSRISRYGLTAYSSSFDTVGLLTSTVEDAAIILEVIAGKDENDSTSSARPVDNYSADDTNENKYKIGFFREFRNSEDWEPAVKENFDSVVEGLQAKGHSIIEFDFPYIEYLLATYYILTSAEASANLSRYDGVRYGYRITDPQNLELMFKETRTHGFGKEVLRRILLGTFVLSASYHDAFYTKAQKSRNIIKKYTEDVLSQCDFILMPTTPTVAFEIGSKTLDPIQMYLSDLFTVQASVAGIPAISIPKGHDDHGLPVGIQIMTAAFEEKKLIKFSKEVQEM